MTELDTQTQAALAAIADAASLEALEEQRLAALGKKGWVSLALKTLGGMSPDERTAAAPAIQSARAAIADALDAKKAALEAATTMLAMALAPQLRVCGVAPGITLLSGPMPLKSGCLSRRQSFLR